MRYTILMLTRRSIWVVVATLAFCLCLFAADGSNTVAHVVYRWPPRPVETDASSSGPDELHLKYRLVSKMTTNMVVFASDTPATVKSLLTRIKLDRYEDRVVAAIVRTGTNGIQSITEVNTSSVSRELVTDVQLKNGDQFVVSKKNRGIF